MESSPVDTPFSSSGPGEGVTPYDAILVVGFGGPERREDVLPFLENVTRGRNIPRARLLEVAEHYDHFGGVSPINAQVRALIAALQPELDRHGISLPIYWGNRNWHPMLADTLAEMTGEGVKKALAVVLAAYSSYSSCRQYREDIERARAAAGPNAPQVDKVRVFYNHPEFIAANADRVREALERFPAGRRDAVQWPSPPTAFRSRWPGAATMSTSSAKRAGWSPAQSGSPPSMGRSSTRAGAGGRRIPGSSRISSIISRT